MSNNIIQLNDDLIKTELKILVKQSVMGTLNSLLDQEAQQLTEAEKYACTAKRNGYRSSYQIRQLQIISGEMILKLLGNYCIMGWFYTTRFIVVLKLKNVFQSWC